MPKGYKRLQNMYMGTAMLKESEHVDDIIQLLLYTQELYDKLVFVQQLKIKHPAMRDIDVTINSFQDWN